VPDSVNHGVRGAVDFEREDSLDSFFWQTILKSVKESSILLKGIRKFKETDNIYKKESNKFENSDKYLEQIKKYDPLNNLNNLNNRPLLMIHGDVDTSVPLIGQKNFYTEAKKYYKDNKKIELYEVPGVDHHITINMVEKAIRWLKKYL